ncbi:MAG TPA: hypothetical protein PKW18_11260 [Candidatus Sumerlaeota bacterium]|nr:hypothetical protein [Candidatus Sumerlaeota bacterium]HON50708.1 hypothetical protein [Candidatus Sumerlaeota bacterium]HOR65174.1 hypothetical protein [Candidatus Sumerlaeota bacterium]HPL75129.1 hypothetical protein [Candidatus Sumerlaeota bacterium]HRU53002.1 hypothetical protein [Candidatus Sumerlaeia bacterium]
MLIVAIGYGRGVGYKPVWAEAPQEKERNNPFGSQRIGLFGRLKNASQSSTI